MYNLRDRSVWPLHIFYLVRQVIKCRVTIYLIICRVIQRFRFIRIRSMYVFTFHHPNAHTFHPACIYISCIFYGHLCICRVQAACVLMVKPGLAADKNFPQWPFTLMFIFLRHCYQLFYKSLLNYAAFICALFLSFLFCEFASAASRTHSPFSHAFLRVSTRSLLQGPLPFTTFQNSSQLMVPKS